MANENDKRAKATSATQVSADRQIKSVLKTAVEINLARERALVEAADSLPGAWHSNGVIFSKSGNGTPFSNGVIFSKTGRSDLAIRDPIDQSGVIQQLTEFDEAVFQNFTDRLLKLKQIKAQRRDSH